MDPNAGLAPNTVHRTRTIVQTTRTHLQNFRTNVQMLTDRWLGLAYPEAALDVTIRNQNQNWHPQMSTCDSMWFFLILTWSWLHILLPRWMSPFETKIKTDIPKFQHVDFWWFRLSLIRFCWILMCKRDPNNRSDHPNTEHRTRTPNSPNSVHCQPCVNVKSARWSLESGVWVLGAAVYSRVWILKS